MGRWVGTLLSDGTREQAVRAWLVPAAKSQNHPRVPSTLSFHEIKNETAEIYSLTQVADFVMRGIHMSCWLTIPADDNNSRPECDNLSTRDTRNRDAIRV